MNSNVDIDPTELDPQTIRFRGDELGVVTELPNGTSRLVLKPPNLSGFSATKKVTCWVS
jgi:hypothetical protein